MPVNVSIDVEKNMVVREVVGAVNAEEMIESFEAVMTHPDFVPGMKSLTDLRQVIHQADKEYVMRIANAILDNSDRLVTTKVAVITSSAAVFGMMRML